MKYIVNSEKGLSLAVDLEQLIRGTNKLCGTEYSKKTPLSYIVKTLQKRGLYVEKRIKVNG